MESKISYVFNFKDNYFIKKFRNFEFYSKFISFLLIIYSLFFLFGFNYPLILFLIIFSIYIVKNKDKNKINNTTLISDLLLSIFILCTLGKDANSLIQIRQKLFSSAVILPSISFFISIEYLEFLKRFNYNFKSFTKARTSWPLLAILFAIIYAFRSVIDGDGALDIIHYLSILLVILIQIPIYGFFNKENINNKFKNVPIGIFLILILLCRSKASILINISIFLFIFDELFLVILFDKLRLKEKYLFLFRKSIKYFRRFLYFSTLFFLISIIFFTNKPFIFNDYFLKLSNNLTTYRVMINNSYIDYCKAPYIADPIKPAFLKKDQKNIYTLREIIRLSSDKIRFQNKLSKFSDRNIVSNKIVERFRYHHPHSSILNYFCIYSKLWTNTFIIFLISITFYSFIKFGWEYSFLFIISYSMLFIEYIPFIPNIGTVISTFLLVNLIFKFKSTYDI